VIAVEGRISLLKRFIILPTGVIVCVVTAAGGLEAGIHPQVPVIIEQGEARCAAGVVHNVDRNGDGFLAVKAGPGLHYERIDKLSNGKQVLICGDKGAWQAIIYSTRKGYSDCNVKDYQMKPTRYTGPCRSGWAHERWIKQTSR